MDDRSGSDDPLNALPAPTSDAADIEAAALEVLSRFADDRPIRLLGVRAEFASS